MFTAVCENESEISFLITRVAAGSVCDWVSYEGVVTLSVEELRAMAATGTRIFFATKELLKSFE